MAETKSPRCPAWLVGLLLGGAVLALYARAGELDFVNFDDDFYVSRNAHVQQGLTAEGLRWAFTSREAANWHPLTWLSLQLDSQLFGTAPAGYHRTNVLLHACDTVLLFWLLQRMTGALWCSAAVAAFFGLHPVHVEAVAWVTARKDVLSTLFWLLTIAAYLCYAKRPTIGRYVLVVLLLALGLMAKQMLVTLPAVLLLLDYWPLCRWPAARTTENISPQAEAPPAYAPASLRWLLLEKLPLLALVIPASLLTLWAQAPIIYTLSDYTVYDRVSNSLVAYVRYLGMAIWPVDLAILYPLPQQTLPLWQPLAAFGLLAALTLGLLWASRSRRYLAVGWLWYLGTLFPVIRLVQNGPQALADRYVYVPSIGLYIAVAWTVAEVCPRAGRRAVALLAGTALACCVVLSWWQIGYWRDSETLWRHALEATTDNESAHTMLAKALVDKGELPQAAEQFEAALRLRSDNVSNHSMLAKTLLDMGEYRRAAEECEAALRLRPDDVANLANLAVALVMLGRLDEAATRLERSLQVRPDYAFTHFNLGSIRERQGRLRAALRHYTTALELDPHLTQAGVSRAGVLARLGEFARAQQQLDRLLADDPHSAALHTELGRLLRQQGQFAEAVACHDRALKLQPDYVEAWNARGFALEGLGRFPEAASCYRRAIELQPQELLYHLNLAYVESASGQELASAEQFRAAFELQPNWPGVALADAWARATHPEAHCRDGALALRLATLVCKATNDQMAQAIDVQAAAYAELGQFDQAVARQRKVLSLLGPEVLPAIRTAATERLHLYKRHQPYRQDIERMKDEG